MKLKAGKYWIGDPCYVLDVRDKESGLNFDWMEFCRYSFKDDPSGRKNEGVIDHQGLQFAYHGTEYGDGCYDDQHGNSYGVDAGMIGCIPLEAIEPHVKEEDLKRLGTVHTFDSDFTSEYDDGKIIFGEIEIITGGRWEEVEECEECGEDEDYCCC